MLFSSLASIAVAILGIPINVDNSKLSLIMRICIFFRGVGMFLFSIGAMIPVLIVDYSMFRMVGFVFVGSVVWVGSLLMEQRLSKAG